MNNFIIFLTALPCQALKEYRITRRDYKALSNTE